MSGRRLQERNARLMRANPFCVQCAAEGVQRVVDQWDHVVELADGGPDVEANLQGLCHEHHVAKSAREAAARGQGVGGSS